MSAELNPILPTTHGYIKGTRRSTIYDKLYYSFEKIPYAKPPLAELRFKSPQPAKPWDDVLDCTGTADVPLQKNQFTSQVEGSEDCLYLNVYVKKLQSIKPLPVMIYVYGGAFQTGGATRDIHGPDYFMEEDVILVTFNYRLGPLGFLSLGDPSLKVPGNAGLKDQIAALSWFSKNCINFNGDLDNITLFGNSAGSASVHYLMTTNQTKGLFNKAILQSGTMYNKWSLVPPGDYAYRLANHIGYTGTNNDQDVYEYLAKADAIDLVGHELITEEERLNDVSFIFAPTVESYIDEDCVLPENPLEMLEKSWGNQIPVLIGGTSFEGLLRYPRVKANPQMIERLNEHPEWVLPAEVREVLGDEKSQARGKELIELYAEKSRFGEDSCFEYLELYSHKLFWLGFVRTLESRLIHGAAPTYLYRFDFDSPTFNFYRLKYCGPNIRGVSHADDLAYLFHGKNSYKLAPKSAEYLTIRRMIGMWTTFAAKSDPNCRQIDPEKWLPISNVKPYICLNINSEVEMQELPEMEKLAHWLELYQNYSQV